MEKFNSIDRVVGAIPEKDKNEILEIYEHRFKNQYLNPDIPEFLYEDIAKTEEEIKIINLANSEINNIKQKLDLPLLNIQPKNIHIVKRETWTASEEAYYHNHSQSIFITEDLTKKKLEFLHIALHEMLHFNSYNSLQILKNEPHLDTYRVGLGCLSRDGKKYYFSKLNEGVTEELTKKIMLNLIDDPIFKEERKKTADMVSKYPEVAINGKEIKTDNKDIFYLEAEGGKATADSFGYKKQRSLLNILVGKIFDLNIKHYQNKEEIMEIFYKGMFDGNLLPLGRLIDGSFGKDTFRHLGELDEKYKEKKEFIESL